MIVCPVQFLGLRFLPCEHRQLETPHPITAKFDVMTSPGERKEITTETAQTIQT